MFVCSSCDFCCSNHKYYFSHIKYAHNEVKKYLCDKNCGRVYNSFDSFKKHVIKIHGRTERNSKLEDNNIVDRSTDELVTMKTLPKSSHDFQNQIFSNNSIENKNHETISSFLSKENDKNNILHSELEFSGGSQINLNNNPIIHELFMNADTMILPENSNFIHHNSDVYNDMLSSLINKLNMNQKNSDEHIEINEIYSQVVIYVSKLLSFQDVACKRAQEQICDTNILFNNVISNIENDVLSVIQKNTTTSDLITQVKSIFSKNYNIFNDFNTKHKVLKTFNKLNSFISPESILLGYRHEFTKKDNIQQLQMKPVTAEFIPLRKVLKSFFEIPQIFVSTIEYMNNLMQNK